MEVRPACPDELDAIADAVGAQPLLARYGHDRAALRRLLAGALERGEGLLVAVEASAIRGMAWFLAAGTFALGGYLRLILVAAGHERRGVGALLLDAVERAVAPASRALFLLCAHDNAEARRFYAARGYREAGALPSLVRDDVDEIILWRKLR
jgi:ribosomal protein S18 acetylase RimI-like enzyme